MVSMMVVTLTVVSSFDQKESRAYDILFRLNIKQGIRKKATFVVTLAIKIFVSKNQFAKGKITKEQFVKRNILLKSQLEMRLQYFRDSAAKISAYEITSEESLRQLTEKIDRDLDEVKEILLSMIEMEKKLNEIEQSQLIVANAMNECINFTNNLEDHLNEYKEKIIKKVSFLRNLKENNMNLFADLEQTMKENDLNVKKLNSNVQLTESQDSLINKLIEFN